MDFNQKGPPLLAMLGLFSRAVLWAVEAPPEPLTNAAAVLSLTANQASQRLRISVTGIVTAAESDWSGQFFLQDATGGVFVENRGQKGPKPGDVLAVTGVSHPGAYAPIISEPHWQKIATADLPPAKPVLIENLVSGIEDSLRVEVSGVVRSVSVLKGRLELVLAVGGYRLQVRTPMKEGLTPETLLAARVRVRGTTGTHYNSSLRHLTSVALYVPSPDDFTVLEPETFNPFVQTIIPLNNVAQYRRESSSAKRVHVLGTVTYQRLGEDVFLQDASGGIRIESMQREVFVPGEQVEAVGFLEYEGFLPLLRDAVLRKTGLPGVEILPHAVPTKEIRSGLHHADLLTIRGKILDRVTRPISRPNVGFAGLSTTWLLQGDGLAFTVEWEERQPTAALESIAVGSVVEVDGVCVSKIDADNKLKAVEIILPSPTGMRVLAKPSWLTPERLLLGVGVLSFILLAFAIWLLTVAKKNAALKTMIRALEKVQRELQEAHDTLEQKVIERSNQLQTEMTARKTTELQFRAVLTERTRLARDLHDTLEQTLTGIALQLDTATKLFERSPGDANQHLQRARNWLRQSQIGLRRSIWDLRSRELEQFDLAYALQRSAEQLVDGTSIQLMFSARGEKRRLPEVVEENVLRIGQEALTNIAKHAQATRVDITLEFSPHALQLRVEDNGVGFVSQLTVTPSDNHFGLLGMSERAKRLAGHLVIDSLPGRGTFILVEIPLAPEAVVAAGADADTL